MGLLALFLYCREILVFDILILASKFVNDLSTAETIMKLDLKKKYMITYP